MNPLPTCTCDGCTCNLVAAVRKSHESNQVICFLRGLNKAFSTVKSQIMVIEPVPKMNKVFSLVLQFENQFLADEKELEVMNEVADFVRRNGSFDNKTRSFGSNGAI